MVRLYHGTASGNLDGIFKEGLYPSQEEGGFTLTDDRELAKMWAMERVEMEQEEGTPVVLVFEIPAPQQTRYLRFGHGNAEGEVALKRILPSDFIVRIFDIEPRSLRMVKRATPRPVRVRPHQRRR